MKELEDMEVFDVDELELLDQPLEEEKEGFLKKAGNWCSKHKSGIVTGFTLVTPLVAELIKALLRKGVLKEERALKELMYYDRDHGHNVEAIRKLTSSEMIQFDNRRDRGEGASEILRSMGLLDED